MTNRLFLLLFALLTICCNDGPRYIWEDDDDDDDGDGESGSTDPAGPGNGYATQGNQIIGPDGQPVTFQGVNWFGFEGSEMEVYGLNRRSLDSYLQQIASLGFNLIRLPFSNEMLDVTEDPFPADSPIYDLTPELRGLAPIDKMDVVIAKANDYGIKILLDRHRINMSDQSDLWYEDPYTEADWINDWIMLAQRYAHHNHIIGADLHNEPRGNASWGTDIHNTDWRLAAQRAGNAILNVEPRWLIVVEGCEKNVSMVSGYYWAGGNLKGVAAYPVQLNVPNKLVYSAHDYGPEVSSTQEWLNDAAFPNNLPQVWDDHWGYIHKQGIAPVLVGEFGVKNTAAGTDSGMWFRALINYIDQNNMSWTFWAWNPNSGDTGGLLSNNDWQTLEQEKYNLLQQLF